MPENDPRLERSGRRLELSLLAWTDLVARAETVLDGLGRIVPGSTTRRRTAAVNRRRPAFPLDKRWPEALIWLTGDSAGRDCAHYEIRYRLPDEDDDYRSLLLGIGPGMPAFAYTVWQDRLGRTTAARPASRPEAEAVCADLTAILDRPGATVG